MNNYSHNSKEHLVDFKAFYKTSEQKAEVHTIKKVWQATMRMFYGDAWRKQNNFPETLNKA